MANCSPCPVETPGKLLLPPCSSTAVPKAFETRGRSVGKGPVLVLSVPSAQGTAKEAASTHPLLQGGSSSLLGPLFFTSSLWMVFNILGKPG